MPTIYKSILVLFQLSTVTNYYYFIFTQVKIVLLRNLLMTNTIAFVIVSKFIRSSVINVSGNECFKTIKVPILSQQMGGLFQIRIFDYSRFNIKKTFTNFNYKEKKLFLFTFILFSTYTGAQCCVCRLTYSNK